MPCLLMPIVSVVCVAAGVLHACASVTISRACIMLSVLIRIFYSEVHRTHSEALRGPRGRKAGHNF